MHLFGRRRTLFFNTALVGALYPDPEIVQLVSEIYDRLLETAEDYKDSYTAFCKQFEPEIKTAQYGSSGKCIHRGFCCPSPVYDILAGGCGRGKTLRRVKNRDNVTAYGFDGQGQLIIAERPWYEREFILSQGNREIGFTYGKDGWFYSIAECLTANNLPKRYVTASYLMGKLSSINIRMILLRKGRT